MAEDNKKDSAGRGEDNKDASQKDPEEMNADEVAEEQMQDDEEVKKELKGLFGGSSQFFSKLLDIRKDADHDATRKAIIQDIPFRGHTAWILVCSIFICSVGLNANSTAVVIGAMLIAPLMGPILGIGMSIAINDLDTLKRSLVHFSIMIVLSVLTAFLFFKLFPLRQESSELLARIEPDIRDVVIAFFGGLALVVARAKRGTIASVIYGAAIATALMPPLCTVGYGLAIGNFSYAGGALYLFTINTIFIALATFLVLKFLRFPMVKYANSKKRRIVGRIASAVAILVMIPAGYTFYNTLQESRYRSQAIQFIKETVGEYDFKGEGRYLENLTDIKYVKEGTPQIQIVSIGETPIPPDVAESWKARLKEFSRLGNTELSIIQGAEYDDNSDPRALESREASNKSKLADLNTKIKKLEAEVSQLSQFSYGSIPFREISNEVSTLYKDLEELGFSYNLAKAGNSKDTIPIFHLKWRESLADSERMQLQSQLLEWLKVRLKYDNIQLDASGD